MTMAARMKAKSDTDSATADTNNMDIEAYFGCKYLTSSDLLSLQIRDPSFRLQLAAQILFYINFLRWNLLSCFFIFQVVFFLFAFNFYFFLLLLFFIVVIIIINFIIVDVSPVYSIGFLHYLIYYRSSYCTAFSRIENFDS